MEMDLSFLVYLVLSNFHRPKVPHFGCYPPTRFSSSSLLFEIKKNTNDFVINLFDDKILDFEVDNKKDEFSDPLES